MTDMLRNAALLLARGWSHLQGVSSALKGLKSRQEDQGRQLAELDRGVKSLAQQVRALHESAERASARQHSVLETLKKETKTAGAALRRSGDVVTLESETRGTLERLAGLRGPILVGPWVSEVGFEVLYWIPFLRWLIEQYSIDPKRLIVCTRGGAGCWYEGLGTHGVEIFDLLELAEFRDLDRRRQEATGGMQKQVSSADLDEVIVDRARDRLGLTEVGLLHPSLMYQLFRPLWQGFGLRTLDLWRRHTAYRRCRPPQVSEAVASILPERFFAVRFYERPTFASTPETRRFVADIVQRLSRRAAVVSLDPGFTADDHRDFALGDDPSILRIDRIVTPQNNLLVQSEVISRASGFIGTYGGLAYVPSLYGVPSISFYSSRARFPSVHLEIAERAMLELDSPFRVLHTKDLELLRELV